MKDMVKVVILAAGKGTRMKSTLPKVLHKILGYTLLERVINSVLKLDNRAETIVITGYQSEEVQASLVNLPVYTVKQEPQLGTGHAVAQAGSHLEGFGGTVMVLCGDTPLLTTETLAEFLDFHKKSGSAVTVMSAMFDDPTNYGRIIRNSSSNIEKIVEEKDANPQEKAVKEINAGVYCFDWEKIALAFGQLTNNNKQGEYYLTDVIDWAVKKNYKASVYTLKNNYEIFGINSQKHLAEAIKMLNTITIEKLMDSGVTFVSPETTFVSPETVIGQDSTVYPGCVFEGINNIGKNNTLGPNLYLGGNVKTDDNVQLVQSRISNSFIGADSTVGPFAHLRDCVEVASNVRIGNFVEIKKSVIKENTNVSHLSYIGDSSLGNNVNIGAGTITANYNPLTKEKNLTSIGNNVKIGSNSVLVAPVSVKEGANVAAGSVITKDVPEYSLAIARGKQQVFEKWVEKKIQSLLNIGGNKSGTAIEREGSNGTN